MFVSQQNKCYAGKTSAEATTTVAPTTTTHGTAADRRRSPQASRPQEDSTPPVTATTGREMGQGAAEPEAPMDDPTKEVTEVTMTVITDKVTFRSVLTTTPHTHHTRIT